MNTELGAIRRKLVLLAGSAWAVLVLACVGSTIQVYRQQHSRVPSTANGSFFPAYALGWPWKGFPRPTDAEVRAVRELSGPRESWVTMDLRPWRDIPLDGPFGVPVSPRRDLLKTGVESLGKLASSRRNSSVFSPQWPNPKEYQEARDNLTRANAGPTKFVGLYNRGLLQLWNGQAVLAAQDLQTATIELESYLGQPIKMAALSFPQKEWIHEAAIHSHYALGHAFFASERPQQAIQELRRSTDLLTPLLELRARRYTKIRSPLDVFSLEPTGLNARSLWNDLIAVYLAAPNFPGCMHPGKTVFPKCPVPDVSSADPCRSRDVVYCQGEEVKAEPYTPAWNSLSQEVYADSTSNREQRLWALSKIMEFAAVNPHLSEDPYLLYNSAALLAAQGEFQAALEDVEKSMRAPRREKARGERLDAILKIATGQSYRNLGASKEEYAETASMFRVAYFNIYGSNLGLSGFPRQDNLFPERGEEEMVDRWLFIRRWRESLRQGDFQKFQEEYNLLLAREQDGLPVGFFKEWHENMLKDFGRRALEKAELADHDQANAIRRFLTESGVFPPDVVQAAQGRFAAGAPRLWIFLSVGTALMTGGIGLYLLGLVRLYRRTFMSSHRISRKVSFEKAYPSRISRHLGAADEQRGDASSAVITQRTKR